MSELGSGAAEPDDDRVWRRRRCGRAREARACPSTTLAAALNAAEAGGGARSRGARRPCRRRSSRARLRATMRALRLDPTPVLRRTAARRGPQAGAVASGRTSASAASRRASAHQTSAVRARGRVDRRGRGAAGGAGARIWLPQSASTIGAHRSAAATRRGGGWPRARHRRRHHRLRRWSRRADAPRCRSARRPRAADELRLAPRAVAPGSACAAPRACA